ncbi:MAG: VOC family protein [Gemmatimonadota bacterium]
MKGLHTYLNFDGNTREAMTFYQQCLGAEMMIQTFGEAGVPIPGAEERIVHARLTVGGAILMASDTPPADSHTPGMETPPFRPGNNFSISIDCESVDEANRLFAALGEGGTVTMPLMDMFWGAYFGCIVDKFGVSWMFNHEYPKQA